jgi:hypothetical protein
LLIRSDRCAGRPIARDTSLRADAANRRHLLFRNRALAPRGTNSPFAQMRSPGTEVGPRPASASTKQEQSRLRRTPASKLPLSTRSSRHSDADSPPRVAACGHRQPRRRQRPHPREHEGRCQLARHERRALRHQRVSLPRRAPGRRERRAGIAAISRMRGRLTPMPRDRPRDLLNPTAGETRLFPASRGCAETASAP